MSAAPFLPAPDLSAQAPPPRAANFLQRAGALMIDAALIYLVATLLGKMFYAPLMNLNPWLPWLGQLALLLYFGLTESPLCGGQTLGKSILRLRTIAEPAPYTGGAAEAPPAYPTAFLRAAIKALCFGVVLQPDKLVLAFPPAARPALLLTLFLLTVLALALLIGQITTLFMHPRRRALHDLIAGTRVVRQLDSTEFAADPELNPIEESRQRLAHRFGMFATFTSFMLLGWFAVGQAWLSPAARAERELRQRAAQLLELGPYHLQGVSFPTAEKAQRVRDFIAARQANDAQNNKPLSTTDSLRTEFFFDDQRILAVYDRSHGSILDEPLESSALIAQTEVLRAFLWQDWLKQQADAQTTATQGLTASSFDCILHEDFSLLYYRHNQPGTTVRISGPADPAGGPLTYQIVKDELSGTTATTPSATPTPAAGQPLDDDAATTR